MQRSNYLFLNILQSVVLHSPDINLKFNYLTRKIIFCTSSSSFLGDFFFRHKESVRISDNPRDFPEILNKIWIMLVINMKDLLYLVPVISYFL